MLSVLVQTGPLPLLFYTVNIYLHLPTYFPLSLVFLSFSLCDDFLFTQRIKVVFLLVWIIASEFFIFVRKCLYFAFIFQRLFFSPGLEF